MIEEIKKFGTIDTNASLKNLNTYKVEVVAKYLIAPNSIDDLVEILKILKNIILIREVVKLDF